jgi:hypothetical protein
MPRYVADQVARLCRSAAPPMLGLGYRNRNSRKPAEASPDQLIETLKKIGAGEGIRTLDPNLGKVVLYP